MNDVNPAPIEIGGARIGCGRPVYVIAEAGVNHNGDLATAMAMVDAAAAAGADAVKFQAFRAAALVSDGAACAAYQKERGQGESQREMLRRLELSRTAFAEIARYCRDAGIEFLATPFGAEDLQMLRELGIRAVKIASPDITNVPLLQVAARTRLPLIISTGAADEADIDAAVSLLDEEAARNQLILLHCVSCYPAEPANVNLRRMQMLATRYGRPAGFSDHTSAIQTGALAVAAGAVVLEKHFTLSRRQDGPDHVFSLEPDGLCRYVAAVRHAEVLMGVGGLAPADREREVRDLARTSVVASAFIAEGERVERTKLTVKRPGTGIPPRELPAVAGRIAARDIPADTLIQWEMLR